MKRAVVEGTPEQASPWSASVHARPPGVQVRQSELCRPSLVSEFKLETIVTAPHVGSSLTQSMLQFLGSICRGVNGGDAKILGLFFQVSPPSLHSLSVAAMGSFAKVLSQLGNVASARLAAPAATGTSRGIIQGSRANKQGLSLMLDGTLKAGHDMKTFGLGTAASLATVERYARFTAAMHHVYGTMERSFDASTSPVVVPLWQRFGDSLRREPSLALDLADVSSSATLHSRTPATAAYCAAIEDAAARDNADGGGRLIGHLYCRYFADLFGGQVSGTEWH